MKSLNHKVSDSDFRQQTASGEIRQNNGGLCGCRALEIFAEAVALCKRSGAKRFPPRFCWICSEGLSAKKPFAD